jgi:quercetin dioxygenase-like cupin family protein
VGRVWRRGEDGAWSGVTPAAYADGAERHTIIGRADGATQVELRYFRMPPGTSSARERHAHEHTIVVLEGAARIQLGPETHLVGPGDAVFVAAAETHRISSVGEGPLGFLCTAPVARRRGAEGPRPG